MIGWHLRRGTYTHLAKEDSCPDRLAFGKYIYTAKYDSCPAVLFTLLLTNSPGLKINP
jgi:hypothetical protein